MGPLAVMSLWPRDSVSTTFSSWDNCMQKTYCKWPVISAIIVGSLIVLSLLGCLVSCVCCGVRCCRGCCCCCPSGGSRNPRPKHADYSTAYGQMPPPPPANMTYGAQPPPAAPTYRPPQSAQFNVSRIQTSKADDDALPPMPTWAEATTKRVADTSSAPEVVEMNPLGPQSPNMAMMTGGQLSGRVGYGEISPPHSPPPRTHDGYQPLEQQQQQSYFPQSSYRSYQEDSAYESQTLAQTPDPHPLRPYDQTPSPVSPAAARPTFSPYERQLQSPYQAYSPPIPSSPPPPFSTTVDDMNDGRRPPSLLQVGRKPVANSWRNV